MNDFIEWWHGLDPVIRDIARDGVILVVGLIAGRIAGGLIRGRLVAKGIDLYLRAPWATPEPAPAPAGLRAKPKAEGSILSAAAGWFVMATIWAGAIAWVAWLHGYASTAMTIQSLLSRSWQAAAVIFAAILISGWLARAAYDLIRTPWLKQELDALFAAATGSPGSFSDTAARAICLIIYAVFCLFVPIAVGALFNMSLLAGLVTPAWQLCARLVTALVAFAVGYLGLAWVRSQSKQARKDGTDHSELEYYVGLGIVIATTLLALSVLVGVSSGAGAIAMIALIALIAFLLWPMRTNVRDLWAGLLLRLQNPVSITLEGSQVQVKTIGPIMTTLTCEGLELNRRNSEILAELTKAAKPRD